jgi:hypothetical protein
LPKITETLLVRMERYFDNKIESYAISQDFTQASYYSLNSHSTGFNLAQNVVDSQVNAEEKVTPINLGYQLRPMGVVKGFL